MRQDELFNDGWRDPSDDGRRMVYYVSWVLGFVGSAALSIFALRLLLRREGAAIATEPGVGVENKFLPILFLVLGILFMTRIWVVAFPEFRRLRRQKIKADAFVAGSFLVGLVLIFLGMERTFWRGTNGFGLSFLIVAGIAVLAASLLMGLTLAFLPNLAIAKTLQGAVVVSRYAVDKRLMEIEDHPDPAGEECTPMVRLATADGRQLDLRASASTYDLASPGSRGTARIRGSRLESFRPGR